MPGRGSAGLISNTDPFRRVPAITIAVLTWLALFPLSTVDVYYHLAIGRHILEDGRIPDRGVGSATFADHPWHDNEWGFQLLAAALGRAERGGDGVLRLTAVGTLALILLRAATLALTLALLSATMARNRVDPLSRAVALVLAAFLTFGNLFWAVRPQIFTYLGLAAVAWLIDVDRDGGRRARWAVPLVIAIWANLHGAFVVGIALLLAEATAAWIGREARAKRLTLLAASAPLAACLNPHGVRQLIHPFLYLAHPEIHRGNAEWTRPDLLHLPLFDLTVVLLVVALAVAGRPRWRDLARCGAFLALFATAIRHLPLAAIVIVPVLAATLSAVARRGGRWRRMLPTAPGFGGLPVRASAAAAIVVAIVALSGAKFVGPVPRIAERMTRPMPEAEVAALAERGGTGAVFNAYRFGGFLMYRLYPQARAFMDGRNDLYGTFRDEVYNRILRAAPGWRPMWRRAVREYDVRFALLDRDAPLATALAVDPGWRSVLPPERATPGIVLLERVDRGED